jgi:hypothetical protein
LGLSSEYTCQLIAFLFSSHVAMSAALSFLLVSLLIKMVSFPYSA